MCSDAHIAGKGGSHVAGGSGGGTADTIGQAGTALTGKYVWLPFSFRRWNSV